jgi:hypothetical protein
MKKDYQKIKEAIANVIGLVKDNYDLSEIKQYMNIALSSLEKKEKKDFRKTQNLESSNNWVLKNGQIMSPENAKKLVAQIDKLIELENKKMKSSLQDSDDSEETTLID